MLVFGYSFIINKINRSLYTFCWSEEVTNNFQINTVYSDLLSKVHYHHSDNELWKVSPNMQYLFGDYLPSLPINKKCISFCSFCLLKYRKRIRLCKWFFHNVIMLSLSLLGYFPKSKTILLIMCHLHRDFLFVGHKK